MTRRTDRAGGSVPGEDHPPYADELRRAGVAALLGAAVFLIEAGIAELLLRADLMCRRLETANWAFRARGCQPEAIGWFLRGMARGVVGAVRPDLSPVLGVATMTVAMALVATLLGRVPLKQGLPSFFVVQILAGAIFGLLGFLLVYLR